MFCVGTVKFSFKTFFGGKTFRLMNWGNLLREQDLEFSEQPTSESSFYQLIPGNPFAPYSL
jgi:hypothetical protein